ncbi:hypothetical protein OROMI_003893 [Orobanche minor]
MKPPHQHTRINLDELKTQIAKKLGPDGSKQYFYYLHRFLSLKLSKPEFDKLCLRILGQENIPLHNQFIRSILKNAFSAKTPPSANPHKDDISKPVNGKDISAINHHHNWPLMSMTHAGSPGLQNGHDMLLPVSLRKARSGLCDRQARDIRSALGPHGKMGFTQSGDFNIVLENGDSNPLQHHHQVGLVQQVLETENVGPTPSETDNIAPQKDMSVGSPIRAPLGVPFCPASIGGARRAMGSLTGMLCEGALLDSHALRERMEGIAVGQGLEGVSNDCAHVLNHGLDSYLKGLIKSCVDIVGARNKDHAHTKLINGVKPGHEYWLLNCGSGVRSDVLHKQKIDGRISFQDFRVAMEANPQQLGEDWPLLLEKICAHPFD